MTKIHTMKALLILLFIIYSTSLFSQKGPIAKDEITRIEISICNDNPSIKLLKEGLLCENFITYEKNSHYNVSTFIPLHRIDTEKLNKLQWFIKMDSIFSNDTIIEDVELSNRIDEHSWINILIIHPDYSSNYILWDTGECKKLIKCIELLNDLIPLNDREMFGINAGSYIYSRERLEKVN
jgi:hypothetical protein